MLVLVLSRLIVLPPDVLRLRSGGACDSLALGLVLLENGVVLVFSDPVVQVGGSLVRRHRPFVGRIHTVFHVQRVRVAVAVRIQQLILIFRKLISMYRILSGLNIQFMAILVGLGIVIVTIDRCTLSW